MDQKKAPGMAVLGSRAVRRWSTLGQWQAQFQSDGVIAARSKSVEVTEAATVKRPEIRFNLKIYISWDAKFIRIEL
jgi:hypothetical protein